MPECASVRQAGTMEAPQSSAPARRELDTSRAAGDASGSVIDRHIDRLRSLLAATYGRTERMTSRTPAPERMRVSSASGATAPRGCNSSAAHAATSSPLGAGATASAISSARRSTVKDAPAQQHASGSFVTWPPSFRACFPHCRGYARERCSPASE